MNDGRRCLIFWNQYFHIVVARLSCATQRWQDSRIMSYALGIINRPKKLCLREHVKTFTNVNSLPQNAPNGVQNALPYILLLKKPSCLFALFDVASYIDPFVIK